MFYWVKKKIVLLLMGCCLYGFSLAEETVSFPLENLFNGYLPGMSNSKAKRLGVRECHVGDSRKRIHEHDGGVFCLPAEDKRALGAITPSEFFLEFDRRTGVLRKIFVADNSPTSATMMLNYISLKLGPPIDVTLGIDRTQKLNWPRNDDVDVSALKGQGMWFYAEYVPGRQRRRELADRKKRDHEMRLNKEAIKFESH